MNVQRVSLEDLSEVVAMLDQEFIHKKQRTLSFANRFPGVYCLNNITNIYVIKEAGRVISSIAVKHSKWLADGHTFDFAMVGGVCTSPEARGHGLASTILEHIGTALRGAGLDFAVLWTTQPSLYERIGWYPSDRGIFGTLSGKLTGKKVKSVSYGRFIPQDVPRLEAIRAQWLPFHLIRKPTDYLTIPLPAQSVERFAFEDGYEWSAYAIVGRVNNTGYVYEVAGDPGAFPALWSAIGETYQIAYINDCVGSSSAHWLDTQGFVNWVPQNLAMWQILSPRLTIEQVQGMYIPFLDRI